MSSSPLRALVSTSRPVSWVNTAYPFAAAYLLSGGGQWWLLIVGTVYFLVPYNLAMYGINDVFDYESDLRNPRKGGAQGAVLDRSVHRLTLWAAGLTNIPFLIVLVATGTIASNTALGLSVFAVLAYSAPVLRFKERPVLDSITSSSHFVGPALVGALLSGTQVPGHGWFALGAFFCWGMASHALGAIQDIEADRGAGIASIATHWGARNTVRAVMVAYLGAGVLLLGAGWPGRLAALLVLPYLANVWPVRAITDDRCTQARPPWLRFMWLNQLTGFALTLLLIWIARS